MRHSKRELERAVDDLDPTADYDGPSKIVINDYVVPTDWDGGESDDGEKRLASRTRITRDAVGDWHTEREDFDS
ncbi:hypothetical protein [Halobacterium jilantaiense]|uniref:Uncharacterized protein n=1 Tax=Halobacterium jilantaiense TaxID=355548 RepID=A0A1I0Q0P6_9EURY|nr:hypothetical protein [Halobacterium jilantaiense]SEW20476.1 hypothetical protein SAMN04487945_2159 [Halobacterium jilantaiense]